MSRRLQIAVLLGLVASAHPMRAQSIADCVAQSALAGVLSLSPVNLVTTLGIPEVEQSPLNTLLGVKTVQACTINATVNARNGRYKQLLGREVAQFHRLDSLFHHVELVVAYGDAPGSQVQLGGPQLEFLRLLPTMMAADWVREGAHGVGAGVARARPTVGLVTGSPALVQYFGGRQAGAASLRYQAGLEGAETAIAAALTAEDHATDAATMLDALEAELRQGPISSGRAKQLRAVAAVRAAVMTNQRLRDAAASARTSADLAMSAGIADPITRLARSRVGLAVRP